MTTPATHNADIDDVNIEKFIPLITPNELKTELPLSNEAYKTVYSAMLYVNDVIFDLLQYWKTLHLRNVELAQKHDTSKE